MEPQNSSEEVCCAHFPSSRFCAMLAIICALFLPQSSVDSTVFLGGVSSAMSSRIRGAEELHRSPQLVRALDANPNLFQYLPQGIILMHMMGHISLMHDALLPILGVVDISSSRCSHLDDCHEKSTKPRIDRVNEAFSYQSFLSLFLSSHSRCEDVKTSSRA